MSRRPDLFIIGAQKAGTTSLYTYLEGHPDVYMSPIKEPHYFTTDRAIQRRRYEFPGDEAGYLSLFSEATDEKRLGEASTSYLSSHPAASHMHSFQPEAHIIAMLRNPIDQMQAYHNERVQNGSEPITDFEAAVRADDDRRAGRRLPPGFNSISAVYFDNALFGEHLSRWIETFGPNRVHAIVFDDFAADTAGEFRRVLEFLDVDPTYQPASFEARNASNRRRGGVVRRLVDNRPAQSLRHRALPAVIGETNTYRLARRFSRSKLNRLPYQREEVPAALRKELQERFTPDVARLGPLLGRDLLAEWFGESGVEAPASGRLALR